MTIDRLAISLGADLAADIRAEAAQAGESVSGWLADAARRKLRGQASREALAAYFAEGGEVTPAQREAARDLWQG